VLGSSAQRLVEAYDLAMLDLDGVIYISGHAIDGASEAIVAARAAGIRVAFVTNNASRPPEKVAENLVRLGVAARAEDVVTSAQAAARILASRLAPESPVLMLGGEGLGKALVAEALRPVRSLDEGDVLAVVTGYGPDVLWRDIMRASVRIRDGLWWVATNTDLTIPTSFGDAPGHGVMVRMLEQFTGVQPEVAGKPQRPLLDETIRRVGGQRPLMVGDRLDTDIEGAHHAGVDSLLVLTGVTGLEELLAAPPERRPTYVAETLDGLLRTQPPVSWADPEATCGGWVASVAGGRLQVTGAGDSGDWWRASAVAAGQHVDDAGAAPGLSDLTPPTQGATHVDG
jgi:HAD superfamily hydrolase (TIGR01450 family)